MIADWPRSRVSPEAFGVVPRSSRILTLFVEGKEEAVVGQGSAISLDSPLTFDDLSHQLFFNLFFFGCAGSSLLPGLALVVVGAGHSSVVVCGLLIAVASHVALPGFRAGLSRCGAQT